MALIPHSDFQNIRIAEELSDKAVDRVAFTSDLVGRAMKRREDVSNGIEMPWSKLGGLFKLRPGEFILMGGYSGHRKSQTVAQMMLHAASTGHRVGMLSLEMPVEETFDMLAGMSALTNDPHEAYLKEFALWSEDRIYLYERSDIITPGEAIQAIIGMRKFLGVECVVIDGLMCIDLSDDLDQEKKFAATLAAVAKKFGMTVILIHHMRKPQGHDGEAKMPDKHGFLGSSRLVNLASSVVIVWDDKKKAQQRFNNDPDIDDNLPDYRLCIAKQRNGKFEGTVGFYHHEQARLLCNSRARMYRPIEVRKDNQEAFKNEA